MLDRYDQIDLNQEAPVPTEGAIDLGARSPVILSGQAAEQRALQYQVASKDAPDAPSFNEVLSSIQQGTYESLQEKLAADKQLEQRKIRYGQVQELIQSGQKLTTEQQDFVMGLSEEKFKNPMSIVEEEFAKTLNQFLTVQSQSNIDEGTHKTLDFAENLTAKVMVVNNGFESAKAQYETMGRGDYNRGFLGWLPFYNWVSASRVNEQYGSEAGKEGLPGQGAEIAALVKEVWSIPEPGKMAERYHEVFQTLWDKNPDLAMHFADSMNSYSSDSKNLDNLWSAFDVATTLPLGKLGKGLANIARKKASEKAVEVITEGGVARRTVQAPKAAGEAPKPPAVKKPEPGPKVELYDKHQGKKVKVSAYGANDKQISEVKKLLQEEVDRIEEGIYQGKIDKNNDIKQFEKRDYLQHWVMEAEDFKAQVEKMDTNFQEFLDSGGDPGPLPPLNAGMKGATKVLGKDGAKPVNILDGAGLSKEAGEVEALTTIAKTDDLTDVAKSYEGGVIPQPIKTDIERYNLEKLARNTMTLFNPGKFASDIGTKSSEYARRLIALLEEGKATIAAVTGQSLKVARGTPEAYKVALDEAKDKLKAIFNKNLDTVQDIRYVYPEDSLSGTAYVEALVGRADGGGFKTPVQAYSYGTKVLGLKDQFLIEQNGMENFIRVRKNVDETSKIFRENLMSPDNVSPKGKLPAILQWIRTPEDKFSTFMRAQRSTAVSGSQRVQALMRDRASAIEGLSGTEKTRLDRMMEINRDTIDPTDPTKRGEFYQNIADYETAYKTEFGTLPTEAETNAYFSALQINDIDYVFRNLGIYRDKVRMGYENISIDGLTIKPGTEASEAFEGKVLDNLPFDDGHDAGILVYAGPGDHVHVNKNGIKGEVKELLNKRIKEEGWKVVQVMNPATRAFQVATDKSVNFVVTKNISQAPLSFTQIPYKPGFHVAYKDEFFVKQGRYDVLKDGSKRRTGDSAAMSASSEAKAKKIAENLETARILLNSGDDAALQAHLEKNLPEEWDLQTFKEKFEDKLHPKTGEVIARAHFAHDVPFVSVRTGQSVSDAGVILKDGKGFHELFPDIEDPLTSPYNDFSKVNKQFAGQRDPTLDALSEGSEANPVYRLDKSNLVRPLDVLQNSMSTIIRNRYFEDLQIISAENYVEEFGDILLDSSGKAFSRNELRRNPLLALHEAQFSNKVDPQRISQAKQIRAHILNLLGTPSWTAKHIQAYTDKLKNIAYESMGEKGVQMIPDRLIHTISDPFHYARSVAFHTKLGLFNVVQLFTQGQALAVTTAIAPRYATRSMGATGLMRMLSLTSSESVIDHFAGMSAKFAGTKFGMSKEAFKDSYKWLRETGFDLVGQDHAWRGDIFEEKLFNSAGKKFLDKGSMFFNGTERFTRMNAWNTAYMEYVEKNVLKEGRVTANDAKKILLRAKDLNVNMSRESNAIYQQGFMSSFTQFWGYQARLTDLMIGKRLSNKEKLQLLTGMGAMYGVSGISNTVSPFYNVYDDIREEALARGIDPNAGLMGYVMNGIPAMIYGAAFGDQPNFGERFGPSGFPIIQNLKRAMADEDLPVWLAIMEQAGGAGASITTDIAKDTVPLVGELLAIKDGGTTGNITGEAAMAVLKNISSVAQAAKLYHALKTGEWTSANNATLMDGISTPQAIFHAVTGTQPQDIPDAFFMNQVANEYKGGGVRDELSAIQKDARIYMKNYLKARDEGDEDSAAVWNQRLTILMNGTGMTQPQKNKIFMQSLQGDTMVEAILKKFLRNGPPDQLKARKETFGSKGQ